MKASFSPARVAAAACQLALVAVIAAGCASPSRTSPPASAEPSSTAKPAKPADLNLRGFPVAFQEGYAAGCDSRRDGSRRRDEGRYKADTNYMMGWDDGYSICGARK